MKRIKLLVCFASVSIIIGSAGLAVRVPGNVNKALYNGFNVLLRKLEEFKFKNHRDTIDSLTKILQNELGENSKSLSEMLKDLKKIKKSKGNDPELVDLIDKLEEKIKSLVGEHPEIVESDFYKLAAELHTYKTEDLTELKSNLLKLLDDGELTFDELKAFKLGLSTCIENSAKANKPLLESIQDIVEEAYKNGELSNASTPRVIVPDE